MRIRKDFDFIKKAVYLDHSAGSLKPKMVIDAMNDFYSEYPISPHSADSYFGVKVISKINETRELVANLVDSKKSEVIFTSGTTDSLNKIVSMLIKKVNRGDEILLSNYNHSSNWVPFLELSKKIGSKVISTNDILSSITPKTKIISFAQLNNTIDSREDIKKIYKRAKEVGAILINDAAQAIVHQKVSIKYSDVIVFSGNKLYGPTGVGVLVVKKDLLKNLKPSTFGGGSVVKFDSKSWKSKETIKAFEPGTLNTAGIIGLGAAVKYFNKIVKKGLFKYEKELANYCFEELKKIEGVKIYSRKGDTNILFSISGISSQDFVSYLGHKNIIIRSGEHCAKQLYNIINIKSTARISIAGYNNKSDINSLVRALKKGGNFLEFI